MKESFARLMSEGSAAMEYFYARLFTANPDSRALFPTSMTAQRERHVCRACPAGLEPGQSARMRRDPGPAWPGSPALRRDRAALHGVLRRAARHRRALHRAAPGQPRPQLPGRSRSTTSRPPCGRPPRQDAKTSPPWWIAEIVSHELRSPGVAVIRLRPSEPLPYRAGPVRPGPGDEVAAGLAAVLDRERAAARRPDRAARARSAGRAWSATRWSTTPSPATASCWARPPAR